LNPFRYVKQEYMDSYKATIGADFLSKQVIIGKSAASLQVSTLLLLMILFYRYNQLKLLLNIDLGHCGSRTI
jgi:hypothetical protein